MTDEEFTSAAGQLEQADTELARIEVEHAKAIANARVHNRARKALEDQRDEIRASVQPLRDAVAQYMVEKKRRDAEAAKAQAEANAAKPREPDRIDALTDLVKSLQEQIAAKG